MLSRVGRGRGSPSCTNTKTEQHVKHSGKGRGGPSYTIRGTEQHVKHSGEGAEAVPATQLGEAEQHVRRVGRGQRRSQVHN